MGIKSSQRITSGHRAAVCGLVIAGITYAQACKIAGIPYRLMKSELPEGWHLCGRKRRRWQGAELDEIHAAYMDTNQKATTIATRHGITAHMLDFLAQREGWPPRRQIKRGARQAAQRRATLQMEMRP